MSECLTLAVESVESCSAGVTVVPSKTQFADAGPGLRVRPAGVIHGTGCAALTVCTEQMSAVNTESSPKPIQRGGDPLTDDLSSWLGFTVVVVGGVRGNG